MGDLIESRISELEAYLSVMVDKPKRFQSFHHHEEIAELEGEIKGLKWVKVHCLETSDKNLIEQ